MRTEKYCYLNFKKKGVARLLPVFFLLTVLVFTKVSAQKFDYSKPLYWSKYKHISLGIPQPLLSDSGSVLNPKKQSVFFIFPNLFNGPKYLKPNRKMAYLAKGSEAILDYSASVFLEECDIYAPFYNEVPLKYFFKSKDTVKINRGLELAYADIKKAFAVFLKQPPPKPFFIAGQGQGSILGFQLIHDFIGDSSFKRFFMGGYLAGAAFPNQNNLSGDFPVLCSDQSFSGCIVNWQSFGYSYSKPIGYLLKTVFNGKDFSFAGGNHLSSNPVCGCQTGERLSLTKEDYFIFPGKPGRIHRKGFYKNQSVFTEQEKVVIQPIPLREFSSPGNNYHRFDYQLFYGSLKSDIKKRIENYWMKF